MNESPPVFSEFDNEPPARKLSYKEELRQAEQEKLKKTREALSAVDFAVLREVFAEMYQASGKNPDEMNFFEAEDIEADTPLFQAGNFDPDKNKLNLDTEFIRLGYAKSSIPPFVAILQALAHEEAHAIGYVSLQGNIDTSEDIKNKVGYVAEFGRLAGDERNPKKRNWSNHFYSFNEGVTDLISYRVLERYAEQTGHITKEEIKALINYRNSGDAGAGRTLMRSFVYRLANATGSSEDFIREQLIVNYFTGNNLFEGPYKDFVEAQLGERYLEELSKGKISPALKPDRSKLEKWGRNMKARFLKLYRKI